MFHVKPSPRKAKPKAKNVALSKPRRARGTGTIFEDKRRGGWMARVPVGKLPSGRTRYVEVRGKTQADVVAKMKGASAPGPDLTIGQWAARWVAGLTVRPSTKAGYVRQIDTRIVPELGHVRVAELTVSQVKMALAKWVSYGVPTANRSLTVAATMFAAAIVDGLATRNPFADCPRLKYSPPPIVMFAPDELKALIEHYRIYTASPIIAFLAGTGCRIGEAAALDVSDYDRATGQVSITKTWDLVFGTRAPKSRHSRRTLTVPKAARPAVEYAIGTRKAGVLFRSRCGDRFSSAHLYVSLNAVLRRLKLPPRRPHAIRHGVISLAISAGVPIANVARDAGDTPATIIRTYVHASAGRGLGDALEELLG